MNRIAIIGSGGSEKSTLAVEIGKALDLPVYHLDKHFWDSGWVETEQGKWEEIQREICSKSKWVMHGNYGGTMDFRLSSCDTVVFLDLPRVLCIFRTIKQAFCYRNTTRPDLAAGYPERITAEFIRWMWEYLKVRRPKILDKLDGLLGSKKVCVLDSRKAIRRFIESVEKMNLRSN